VLDDEETVQHAERRGRHPEEIEGNDGLTVVVKEYKPFLGRIPSAVNQPQLASDGPLGEHEAELKFAMDFRGALRVEENATGGRLSLALSAVSSLVRV
jgi:hypothetical protein